MTQEETMTGEKKLSSVVVQEEYPTEWTCYPADKEIEQEEKTSQPQSVRTQAAAASGSYLANFFG